MMRSLTIGLSNTVKRLAACQRGGPAVEMGIILPALSLAIVGTIYIGWMAFSITMLNYSVESAARCVAVATATSTNCGGATVAAQETATQTYAVKQALGVNVTTANFTVSQPANGCGWQVTASYPFTLVMPFWTNNPAYTLTASSCFPVQL
jgi:Flp pilus assembly protein TadG